MNTLLPPLVDSHCHLHSLDLTEFNNDLTKVIAEATAQGVEKMLCVCLELADLPKLQAITTQFPNVYTSVGVHPTMEFGDSEPEALDLVNLARDETCIAIGETGLDYYRIEAKDKQQQQLRFRNHIQAALSAKKPLIIHTRAAAEDTLKFLEENNARDIGGVMHCFTEDWDIAKRALDLNFYISFSGIVSFKNATIVQDVAKKVPLDRILIETDAPYLAPVPYRGKQNHPALVKYVAVALSELRQIDYATVAAQTTENFYRCFFNGA